VTASKVATMQDAVRDLVRDGDTVAIEGFTHLICFAAGHEIIRQRRRDLTLARMTPDVVYDQMIGAGVASKLIFSWMGNPGVGNLHAVRRRIERADPGPLEIEEYSHFGMVSRYMAGAANLPFFPLRSYYESDIPKVNPRIVPMTSPYDEGDQVYVVPPLKPDVTIVHAQRADAGGDTQIWGLLGCQKEAAFAAERTIVVVEEVVEESVIRRDPNRTVIPGIVVDAVVEEPFGCHPSFAQGYYDRDNAFYLAWDRIAKDPETLEAWLGEWVYGTADHREYVQKMGDAHWDALKPEEALSGQVDYGRYA
jgi:glutaconate CoA-transferase, subunit A